MTVSTSTSFVSYAGNGSLITFAYTFKIFQDSDLLVTLINDASGVETTQVLTTNYTVTGAGTAGGGNVVFTAAPASGVTIKIRRVLPVTQETDYVANDPFPAEAHEDALDKLTMLLQQEATNSDLAISFPEGDVGAGLNNIVPSAVDRADKILSFDTEGNVTTISNTTASIAASILGANYIKNTFTGDGATTAFTLSDDPVSKNNIQIYVNGIYQPKDSFSLSTTTLTFSEAPPSGIGVECIIGQPVTSYTIPNKFILGDGDEVTIASGVITASKSYHEVDTESDASTDDLDTINGGSKGMYLVLTAANSARTVVVKDGTGNIQCSGDFSLTHINDTITLIYNGSSWLEISRSNNDT
jgi:hypothetical protein